VALVAPASPFDRSDFDRGVTELVRLGLEPVFDETIFAREPMVAGPAAMRATAFSHAFTRDDVDAVIAVRGGYGSVELLPALDADLLRRHRTAFVGYSDVTSLHVYLNCQVGLASVHGAMVGSRLANGPSCYDPGSFLASLGTEPMGELATDGLVSVQPGEARGPIFGGTLTQIVGSLGTPFSFEPPAGHVLLIDEVAERPYRLRRALMQLRLSGRLARAAAVVFGQLPRCDEPGGSIGAIDVVREFFADFPGPVIFGFATGHTTTPLLSVPLGVETRVIAAAASRLILEEAAAE